MNIYCVDLVHDCVGISLWILEYVTSPPMSIGNLVEVIPASSVSLSQVSL